MPSILEINDIAQFAPYHAAWHELLAKTASPSFFRTPEWLAAQWRHVGADRKLRVLLMHEGERLTGILPLSIQSEATRLGETRLLGFPLDGWGSYYGPLGADPTAILQEGLAHVRANRRDFDVIDLRCLNLGVAPNSIAHEETTARSPQTPALSPWSEVALIDLVGSYDDYLAERKRNSSRFRNVARCERRLQEMGEVTHVRYRPRGEAHGESDPRWDWFEECVTLAQGSWQAGLTEGNTLSHAGVQEFLRDVHEVACRAGALEMQLLYLDRRPVAFMYGYHFAGHVDIVRIGFDPSLAKVAPGNALWTRFIRGAYESGDRVLDLGPTCLDYKQLWINRVDPTQRLLEYSLNPKAQALRLARWFAEPFRRPAEQTNRAAKEAVLASETAT